MKVKDAEREFPNYQQYPSIQVSGSLTGMKQKYGWNNKYVIKIGGYYYNLQHHQNIGNFVEEDKSIILTRLWNQVPYSDNHNAVVGSYVIVFDKNKKVLFQQSANGTTIEGNYYRDVFEPKVKELGLYSDYNWGRLD